MDRYKSNDLALANRVAPRFLNGETAAQRAWSGDLGIAWLTGSPERHVGVDWEL